MTTQNLRENWLFAIGRLKAKYAILTDADLDYHEGQEEELIRRIQVRTGARRDEIERFFEDEHSFHSWV